MIAAMWRDAISKLKQRGKELLKAKICATEVLRETMLSIYFSEKRRQTGGGVGGKGKGKERAKKRKK